MSEKFYTINKLVRQSQLPPGLSKRFLMRQPEQKQLT